MIEQLPQGYEIKPCAHGWLSIFKNGKPLRYQQKIGIPSSALPILFKEEERDRAKRYACKHAELDLEVYEQVVDFEY